MRILIYSDVHGNLPAFEKMLKNTGHCDGYICLGDLVNYGPWSNDCVDLAVSLNNSILLRGNHEEAFLKGHYDGSNRLVNIFFEKTFSTFNRFEEIEKFTTSYQLNEYSCIHTIDKNNIYPDTAIELLQSYIIGHSHHQFKYQNNGYTLINAGSVGQNRKDINICNYLIYYAGNNKIELKSSKYDFDYVINSMKNLNYEAECIAYYTNKVTSVHLK